MNVSIVMTNYNRFKLLTNTIKSIRKHNTKVEIIIVDDGSDNQFELNSLANTNTKIILLPKNKWYVNPCIPFNIGFAYAQHENIIIQNSECYHMDNIVEYVETNLTNTNYLSFSCFSLAKDKLAHSITKSDLENKPARFDGDNGWYNHSVFRNKAYHFCSAIKKSNIDAIHGFSSSYAKGIGYDDDDFLRKIRKLNLNISIIDDLTVLHQYHYSAGPQLKQTNELLFRQG